MAPTSQDPGSDVVLSSLRRRWWVFATLCVLVVIAGTYGLQTMISWGSALRWAGIASLVLSFEMWFLRARLGDNRARADAELWPGLGAGNMVTLLRGVAIAVLAGFLLATSQTGVLTWAPASLYTFAIIADFFDGYLARLTNHVTLLGADLDMEFDALGMLVVTMLAAYQAQLFIVFILVGLARYLFVFGIWWRLRHGLAVSDLPQSRYRRILAGLMMTFMSLVLWPTIQPPVTNIAGTVLCIPFFALFLRDWLVVSQRVKTTQS